MIDQIRHLQTKRPFESFAIELTNGRVIQIYDPWCVATVERSGHGESQAGKIGILHAGAFELINAEHIAAISAGIHPVEEERFQKLRARAEQITGKE